MQSAICKKSGHFKKDCLKCKASFERKSKPSTLVCFESNLAKIPYNTWRINFGCATHVSSTMQGLLKI